MPRVAIFGGRQGCLKTEPPCPPLPLHPASRARPQARKKANDDASYFGPSTSAATTTGTKRQAADKLDGEHRVKRKRVDAVVTQQAAKKDTAETEIRLSLVEFNKMTIDVLHRYMSQFDIVPAVYPSPMLPDDPPVPASIGNATTQTPANRPRRESREAQRRSSRLLEDDLPYRTPALADLGDLQGVLSKIVEKHFRESLAVKREEVDTLASFMCAVENNKRKL
ncbi:hypothetical protein DFP72DRAFT_1039057 [Ephemerocybe angulata]|uniref:Histone deacetylase complex subunit SAP30 Sin3 binding domain-containing protein n=1 Tax=Ephemerocybe angulata TaxID=980116 RepID=A0A8H6IKK2_9AGAR|nr:hypothetical protein DFP72DRAFT_1039057 [Tulosesus angulatus]